MSTQPIQPFTLSFHTLATPRLAPEADALENRWLHKIFVLTHQPAGWSAWQLLAAVLILTGLSGLFWRSLGLSAFIAAGLYLTFALADWGLIKWLARARRSFGPVGPLLFILTIPRLGVMGITALIGWLFTPPVGLLMIILLQLAGFLVYWWGMVKEPFKLGLTRQVVPTPGWPHGAPPLRLLHLSDLHVERLTQREAQLLELVNEAKPDVIVITGDYLNLSYVNEPTARAEVRRVLAQLSAPYGVYATLGSPLVDPRATTPSLFDGLNIRLLRDEVAVLRWADGRAVSLLGLDCDHDLEVDAAAFKQLIALAPADSLRVLLYHSPELMPLAQQYPLNLYLCGHTHGGQARLPLFGALVTSSVWGKRYEMGRYVEHNTMLYISRGLGMEGMSMPRIRLLCPPEMVLFNLNGQKKGTLEYEYCEPEEIDGY
jgi:uncharacterized protein